MGELQLQSLNRERGACLAVAGLWKVPQADCAIPSNGQCSLAVRPPFQGCYLHSAQLTNGCAEDGCTSFTLDLYLNACL